jgi:hypothetical protein
MQLFHMFDKSNLEIVGVQLPSIKQRTLIVI